MADNEWRNTSEELPPLLASVEALWGEGDEPCIVVYTGDGDWADEAIGYSLPTPLKWREVK